MRRGRSDGDGRSVVRRQGKVKGHRGHRQSPVHLHLSGCHTGETLEDEGMNGDREAERREREGVQVTERVRSPERERERETR